MTKYVSGSLHVYFLDQHKNIKGLKNLLPCLQSKNYIFFIIIIFKNNKKRKNDKLSGKTLFDICCYLFLAIAKINMNKMSMLKKEVPCNSLNIALKKLILSIYIHTLNDIVLIS